MKRWMIVVMSAVLVLAAGLATSVNVVYRDRLIFGLADHPTSCSSSTPSSSAPLERLRLARA
jgi:hypothetical protein